MSTEATAEFKQIERDNRRALDAIARALCLVHFTDGFCHGKNKGCTCRKLAKRCISEMEAAGVLPVWVFAPERRKKA